MTLAANRAAHAPTEQPVQAMDHPRRLRRADLSGPSVDLARRLLGHIIMRDDETGRRAARIVETEAYDGPGDRASHARAGRTARTAVMFGPPGHAYVYLVYGMHHCLNVVCGSEGVAAAVLIRAAEPLEGVDTMRTRRGPRGGQDERLGAGPARLCQALDIDRSHSGIDLVRDSRLWLAIDDRSAYPDEAVVVGPRVGVDHAGPESAARPWRFGVAASLALSKPFSRA